jgi:hypothetical protein
VNKNFEYFEDILGENSTVDRISPTAEFALGYRNNTLLTGESDKDNAPTERKFFQIGWNADWEQVSGRWVFSRFNEGEPSSVLRIGFYGTEVLTTSATGGNLNGQLETVFAIRATEDDDYVFIKNGFSIQRVDRAANNLSDYRLTYVPLDPPAVIYDGIPLTNQDTNRDVRQFGVPENAKMVRISVEAKAGPADAYIRFLRHETTPHRRTGITCHVQAGKWNFSEGDVYLGSNTEYMNIRITRVAAFDQVYAYVRGYWI